MAHYVHNDPALAAQAIQTFRDVADAIEADHAIVGDMVFGYDRVSGISINIDIYPTSEMRLSVVGDDRATVRLRIH